MPTHITTQKLWDSCLRPLLPGMLDNKAFPDIRSLQSAGSFSSLLFYDSRCPDFCIRLSNYFIGVDTGWYEHSTGESLLVLQFVLHDSLYFRLDGGSRLCMAEGQYNFIASPSLNSVSWFDPANSHAGTLDIHFTAPLLRTLGEDFPELIGLLENMEKGHAATLSAMPITVSPAQLRTLHSIIDCPYTDDLRRMYMQSKVIILLLQSLDHLIARPDAKETDIHLSRYDLEKIHQSREYLLCNMENPPTLKELAHKMGINDFKLKKGYKQVFGTTIFGDFNKVRMEKARQYLLETRKSISDISLLAGYQDPPNFIRAFKAYYGISPNQFRKQYNLYPG